MRREHTDREYENELAKLREQVLLMGARVEEMIEKSVQALETRDTELARKMIDYDRQINRLEVEIDEHCLRILARRQPVASDLRFLTIALKLVTDLERIGDLGVNICERVLELNEEPPLKPYIDIPRMAEIAISMLDMSLEAYKHRDVDLARKICDRDDDVDALYDQVYRELLVYMLNDPKTIRDLTEYQKIAELLVGLLETTRKTHRLARQNALVRQAWPRSTWTGSPVATSHRRIVWSAPAVARSLPSGLKTAWWGRCLCP